MARRVVLVGLVLLLLVLPLVISQSYDVKIDTEFKETAVKKVNTGNVEKIVGQGFTKKGNVYLVNGFYGEKRQAVFESGGGYKSYSLDSYNQKIGREVKDFDVPKFYRLYGAQPIIEVIEVWGVGSFTADLENVLETTIEFDSGETDGKILIFLTTNDTHKLVNLDLYFFPDDRRKDPKLFIGAREVRGARAKIFRVEVPAGASVSYLGKSDDGKNRVLLVNQDEKRVVSLCPGLFVPDCYYLTEGDTVWAYQITGNRNDVSYASFPWLAYYQFDTIDWPVSLRLGRATRVSPTQHVVIRDSSNFKIIKGEEILDPEKGNIQTSLVEPAAGRDQTLDKSYNKIIRRGTSSLNIVRELAQAFTIGSFKGRRNAPLIFPVGMKYIPGFVLANPLYSEVISNTEFAGANSRLVRWFLDRGGIKGSQRGVDYVSVTNKLESKEEVTSMYRSKPGLNQLKTDGNELLVPTIFNIKSPITIVYDFEEGRLLKQRPFVSTVTGLKREPRSYFEYRDRYA